MAEIILENILSKYDKELPAFFNNLDYQTFGLNWQLHDYQQKALENAVKALHIYFKDKQFLEQEYQAINYNAIYPELSVSKDNTNFQLLADNGYPVIDNKIDFLNFINRASFWMATGSGKTLVLVKLIEQIYQLANQKHIPAKDILILAPKNKILDQIKEHIEIYNKKANIRIELKDLRDWSEVKQQQINFYGTNVLTVFYYRSDNIRAEHSSEYIDYRSIINNGNWYILLDEAHKGDSEYSKSQQYFSILSKNGFLFNFSATFVDTIDIVTTAYNFNLKKFIEKGYGKHIKIIDEEFKNFNNRNDNDFTEEEKYKIVLKSLLILTAIKKGTEFIKQINPDLYHNPLLITIANEVNTDTADLKIFFNQLARIATNDYDLDTAKNELINNLLDNRNYQFNTETVNNDFIQTIRGITKQDVLEKVFNAKSPSKIEYTKIEKNTKEIAFKLKTSEKHFCLLHAAEVTKWEDNILDEYDHSETPVTKSFFNEINDSQSEINILLGSRIFTEGWDSNRPNIVNFINFGVSKKAQKLVLQATGRGVRIQPYKDIRKRLDKLSNSEKKKIESVLSTEQRKDILNKKKNLPIETLYIFATNKEVIKTIIEHLDKNKTTKDWAIIQGIKKNDIKEEIIFVEYETADSEIPPYKLSKKEYQDLIEFIGEEPNNNDKLILMKVPINASKTIVKTLTEIRTKGRISNKGIEKNRTPFDNLLILNTYFNTKPKKVKSLKKITDEIKHYKDIQISNITDSELNALNNLIRNKISDIKIYTKKELFNMVKEGKLTYKQYELEFEKISQPNDNEFVISNTQVKLKINTNFLKEHFYKPIIETEQQFREYVKNIITEPSEIEFLNNLNENKSLLNKYEWWYFSKLVENVDDIYIPYFDTEKQEFRKFYPDFIFWLKKGNKYVIKFIDPKGRQIGINNAKDKANGYHKIFNEVNIKHNSLDIKFDLYFYNNKTGFKELDKYYTKDFEIIFNE